MTQPTEQLIAIIEHIRSKVDTDTDVVWTRYSSIEELLLDLDSLIAGIRAGDPTTYAKLELLFAPTGSFQELAMSNGWGDEFLELANSFDDQITLVKSSR